MDLARVDLVLEFALLAAGRADDYLDRFLGPIHLIKYAYLADLAHAERHGETFTGARWRFFHFGPWDAAVHDRIRSVTRALDAQERTFPSKYADDRTLWSAADEHAFEERERRLPLFVALAVKRHVRKFGHDTPGLLHFVYNTAPMLRAAPGEYLDFGSVLQIAEPKDEVPYVRAEPTAKQKKRRAERIRDGRERLRAKLQQPIRPGLAAPVPPPRYDEVFAEGVAWLDGLAGEPLEPVSGELIVGDGVWKSPVRGDPHDE